ncbi:Radical SAM domain protein [Desulfovibrio sp. X2]|uniref:radical SAM protein n=1 Tax=Desulfovibrio sp. X2 TaxID=941449 RepID=UPI00035894D2|nr:radical SAM protein [Desulfovibrio sp. X2]EPR44354.1 Radical SAM domain protein [Desulfovibrio sp. X2]
MMETVGLTLCLTRSCNAACRHCGLSASPEADETMALDLAAMALQAACTGRRLRCVRLTGGEPMLLPSLVRGVLAVAHRLGLAAELCSNSFFARTPEAARTALEPLAGLGLSAYVTSLDRFHEEYVPTERVRHAVRAALDLGLCVTVMVMDDGPGAYSRREMEMILGLPLDSPALRVESTALVSAGRLAESAVPGLSRLARPAAHWAGPCERICRSPVLTADGRLHACRNLGRHARLIGDIRAVPLPTLLDGMGRDPMLGLLAEHGPAGVYGLLAKRGEADPRRTFLGPCDLCTALWEDSGLRAAAEALPGSLERSARQRSN